jgi:hypothetical protein
VYKSTDESEDYRPIFTFNYAITAPHMFYH